MMSTEQGILPPGIYIRIDTRESVLVVHHGGLLPGSCDGQRAVYARVEPLALQRSSPAATPPKAAATPLRSYAGSRAVQVTVEHTTRVLHRAGGSTGR